jgi:Ca2+-binding EF-hand superfamily protein
VRRKFSQLWNQFFGYEAKTGKVTVDVYLEALRKRGKAKLTRIIIEMFVILFDLIDINGDGVIQKDEFKKFYGIFKLNAVAAAETFKAIDTNKDGTLSADEFVTAGIDFFTSDDENSPYQFLFGPLVSKEEFNTY